MKVSFKSVNKRGSKAAENPVQLIFSMYCMTATQKRT